mmetsp:Transcript_20348/g.65557  ORF Transcript_20348/g.65557 Transcript_20348/m.65557 type:complete len:212 (-) Transcript_20348:359-994(-)
MQRLHRISDASTRAGLASMKSCSSGWVTPASTRRRACSTSTATWRSTRTAALCATCEETSATTGGSAPSCTSRALFSPLPVARCQIASQAAALDSSGLSAKSIATSARTPPAAAISLLLAGWEARAASAAAAARRVASPSQLTSLTSGIMPPATAMPTLPAPSCASSAAAAAAAAAAASGAADVTAETMRKRRTTDAYRSHRQSWTWLRST